MELQILDFIQTFHNPILDRIFIFASAVAEHGEVWIAAAIILLFVKKLRPAAVLVFIALILTFVSGELIIKNLVCRPRPFYENPDLQLIIPPPSGFSFPSSHTATSFAAATVIFIFSKKLGAVAIVLALIIAFSRLYLYVHYPSDVLCGMLLGIFWAVISVSLYRKLFRHNSV